MIQELAVRTWVRIRGRAQAEEGASAVEYALLMAFIAAVIVLAVGALGITVRGLYSSIAGKF